MEKLWKRDADDSQRDKTDNRILTSMKQRKLGRGVRLSRQIALVDGDVGFFRRRDPDEESMPRFLVRGSRHHVLR